MATNTFCREAYFSKSFTTKLGMFTKVKEEYCWTKSISSHAGVCPSYTMVTVKVKCDNTGKKNYNSIQIYVTFS